MKRIHKALIAAGAVLLLWIGAFFIDYARVVSEKTPLFCFKTESGMAFAEYSGLGYGFVLEYTYPVYPGPRVQSYVLYIFGIEKENTLINTISITQ